MHVPAESYAATPKLVWMNLTLRDRIALGYPSDLAFAD
jgi:hypothetical protein